MRRIAFISLVLLSFSIHAQDASVEIAGVTIRNGMTPDELRLVIPEYAIHPIEVAEGVTEDVEFWLVSTGQWADGGEISFENGKVRRATRNIHSSSDRDTYEMFVLLNEILLKLTGGKDTCVMIRTSIPQHIFPQSATTFALPDKLVSVGTGARGEGHMNVSIQESTRVNPVQESERVQKGIGDTGHCVFVG